MPQRTQVEPRCGYCVQSVTYLSGEGDGRIRGRRGWGGAAKSVAPPYIYSRRKKDVAVHHQNDTGTHFGSGYTLGSRDHCVHFLLLDGKLCTSGHEKRRNTTIALDRLPQRANRTACQQLPHILLHSVFYFFCFTFFFL